MWHRSLSCENFNGVFSISDVRLVGDSKIEGRVEIYYNGTWGTVCHDDWDIDDARVVCRQLGFRDAEQYFPRARFDQGTGEIWLDNVNCTGHESSLSLCQSNGWGNHNCRHNEDAGVRCNTKGENSNTELPLMYTTANKN